MCPCWLYRVFVQVNDTAVCPVTHLPASFINHLKLAQWGGGTPRALGTYQDSVAPSSPPNVAEPWGFWSRLSHHSGISTPFSPACSIPIRRGCPEPPPQTPPGMTPTEIQDAMGQPGPPTQITTMGGVVRSK